MNCPYSSTLEEGGKKMGVGENWSDHGGKHEKRRKCQSVKNAKMGNGTVAMLSILPGSSQCTDMYKVHKKYNS